MNQDPTSSRATGRPAVLIPVHNRREITLRCLRTLIADNVPAWADIFVLDDGSTDGTGDAVAKLLSSVRVLCGNGGWWWTGAIAAGMHRAAESGASHFIWLNDDCDPAPGALARLHAEAVARGAIAGGVCLLPNSRQIVYGGIARRRLAFEVMPWKPGTVERCDALCGNLVCVPADVVTRIGFPDATHFPHAHGDLDYTLRASAADIPVVVVHDSTAQTAPNHWENHASWMCSDIPVSVIWRGLWSKRSYGYLPSQWALFTRHFGWQGAAYVAWTVVKRLPITLLHLVLPLRWRRKLWGSHSRVWQEEQRLRQTNAPLS